MENTTMCALMQQTISEHGDAVALRDADSKSVLTWREYGQRVERVARGQPPRARPPTQTATASARLPRVLGDSTGGRVLTYLPDAHVVNRFSAHYAPMALQSTTVTLNEPTRLLEILQQVRPTEFVGVPMLWYRIIGSIQAGLDQQSGLKGSLARWALRTGRARAQATLVGRGRPPRSRLPELVADRLLLARIRRQIGLDQAGSVITGSAPLDQDAMVFLFALGLPISEAWGMSETTGVTTLNTASKPRLGTVGTPCPARRSGWPTTVSSWSATPRS